MNSQFKVKFLQHLSNKKGKEGFTLIELLVVVIIIGVLAAIALPNLLSQVAKGRQAEAKNNLGAVNRAQQAYRLEKATFGKLTNLPIKVDQGQYYTIEGGADSQTFAAHTAKAQTTYVNDIRDYGSGVNQTAEGVFTNIICEADTPTEATPAVGAGAASCPDKSSKVN